MNKNDLFTLEGKPPEFAFALFARNACMYMPPTIFALTMARYELFKKMLSIPGCIIEGGVSWGGGLMQWVQMSYMLEPINNTRVVVGFDTFEDSETFAVLSPEDDVGGFGDPRRDPIYTANIEHLRTTCKRFEDHAWPGKSRIQLVRGNAVETIPAWANANPHIVIAGMNLHFDVYAPTLTALEAFYPRIPRGGIIAMHGFMLNKFPGNAGAFRTYFGEALPAIHRFPWCQTLAWFEKA